jgi:hypothetical protein
VPVTFPDPGGDAKGPGPDLTSITVSNTTTVVTFRVAFAKAPPLQASAAKRWIDMLLIGIDVPPRGQRPTANGWKGVDYVVGAHGPDGPIVFRRMKFPGAGPPKRFPRLTNGSTLTFSVLRAQLGDPPSFDFIVSAGRERSTGGGTGGDSTGMLHYRLVG